MLGHYIRLFSVEWTQKTIVQHKKSNKGDYFTFQHDWSLPTLMAKYKANKANRSSPLNSYNDYRRVVIGKYFRWKSVLKPKGYS